MASKTLICPIRAGIAVWSTVWAIGIWVGTSISSLIWAPPVKAVGCPHSAYPPAHRGIRSSCACCIIGIRRRHCARCWCNWCNWCCPSSSGTDQTSTCGHSRTTGSTGKSSPSSRGEPGHRIDVDRFDTTVSPPDGTGHAPSHWIESSESSFRTVFASTVAPKRPISSISWGLLGTISRRQLELACLVYLKPPCMSLQCHWCPLIRHDVIAVFGQEAQFDRILCSTEDRQNMWLILSSRRLCNGDCGIACSWSHRI